MVRAVKFDSLLTIRTKLSELQTDAFLSDQKQLAKRLQQAYDYFNRMVIKPSHTDERV